jgi:hypothetical protein
MALPQTVLCTGTLDDGEGGPAEGVIIFEGSTPLVEDGVGVVLPPKLFVPIEAGAFAIDVPVVDDPGFSPSGWHYKITERLAGQRERTFLAQFLLADGNVAYEEIVPVVTPPNVSRLALSVDVEGKIDASTPGDEVPNSSNVVMESAHTNTGGSQFTHGLIERASGLLIQVDYDQTQPVADDDDNLVGRFLSVDWNATLSDTGIGFGPIVGKGVYGPPGMLDFKGHVIIARNQDILAFAPITAVDALKVSNDAGNARTIVPSWGYGIARLWVADGAVVTLERNDINSGGAAFGDSTTYHTANTGEIDGLTNDAEHVSFISLPLVLGNTHLRTRIAFEVLDVNIPDSLLMLEGIEELEGNFDTAGNGLVVGADVVGGGTVEENIGVRIPHLTYGTVNIGIKNASTTQHVPVVATLATAAASIPATASLVLLDNTSGGDLVLTSTPAIADGVDGQRLTLLNISADRVSVLAEAFDTGSGFIGPRPHFCVGPNAAAELVWSDDAGGWELVAGGTTPRPVVVTSGTHVVSPTEDVIAVAGTASIEVPDLAAAQQSSDLRIRVVQVAAGTVTVTQGAGATLQIQAGRTAVLAGANTVCELSILGDVGGTLWAATGSGLLATHGALDLSELEVDTAAGRIRIEEVSSQPRVAVRLDADTVDRAAVSSAGVALTDGANVSSTAQLGWQTGVVLGLTGFTMPALEFGERADPAAPAANKFVWYARDNGAGKMQACIRFPSGAVQVVAEEP